MTVLNDRIEVENRLLHRVIETISSSLDLDVILRETIALVRGDSRRGRLPPSVEPRARAPHVARGLRRLRGRRGTRHASHGGGHRGLGGGAPGGRHHPGGQVRRPRYKYIPELRGKEFTSLLSVPLVSRSGKLVGAFNVHGRERRDFSRGRRQFLRSTSSLVAAAIEHANVFRALEERRRPRGPRSADDRGAGGGTPAHRDRDPRRRHAAAGLRVVPTSRRCAGRCPRTCRARGGARAAQEMVDGALEEARWAIQDRDRRRWTTSAWAPASARSLRDRSRTRPCGRSSSTTPSRSRRTRRWPSTGSHRRR